MTSDFVFISYSRDDARKEAVQIQETLEGAGFRTFRDATDIPPSRNFQSELDQNIGDCKAMVLLWSHKASKSPEVTAEWRRALKRDIPLYIVKVDETELDYRLEIIQWVGEYDSKLPSELVKFLKTEKIKTWIADLPNATSAENLFASQIGAEGFTWFYNPQPIDKKEKFAVQFPQLSKVIYRVYVDWDLAEVAEQAAEDDLIVAEFNKHQTSDKKSDFPDFNLYLFQNGDWEELKLVRCLNCWQLQVDLNSDVFDEHEHRTEMYQEWCPKCSENSCIRCGRPTDNNLCSICKRRFEDFGES